MAEEETVKLFVSGGCGPCAQVKKLVEEGKHNLSKFEIIDLMTEEGHPYIEKLGLKMVPVAMKGTKTCPILFDGESLIIDCDGEMPKEVPAET